MSDMRASMQDPFDKLMYEAIDSICLDEEAAQRIWRRIEQDTVLQEGPHVATRRNKAIAGVSAIAVAASICAVAMITANMLQPEVVSSSSQVVASSGFNSGGGVASAAASATTQARDGQDEGFFTDSARRWSIAVSDDITLIARADSDGHCVPTKDDVLVDYVGTFNAVDPDSGRNTTCEVYRVHDSDELYSVRFKGAETLYDAIVTDEKVPMHIAD